MSKVHQKLLQVQIALKAPKSNYNSFGKYSYRSCEDIMEAVKPLLKEQGLTMLISDDVSQIGDRYYIRATVTVLDTESGEMVQASALAREEETKKGMDASQITGTASSYARKYALNGMFAIDDTKDADTRPPASAEKVFCTQCGGEIKEFVKKDGTKVSPEEQAKSMGGLCVKCYRAMNGGN